MGAAILEKACKGAGLNGHLRFTHWLDEPEVNALVASAKTVGMAPRVAYSTNPVYQLMDELTEIQRRREQLKPQTSPFISGSNATVEKALDLLDAMEKEISKKLDQLKRQKGLPVGWLATLFALTENYKIHPVFYTLFPRKDAD